jgi:hypothetical protein
MKKVVRLSESELTNLIKIQQYFCNSLLKYESLGVDQLKHAKKS